VLEELEGRTVPGHRGDAAQNNKWFLYDAAQERDEVAKKGRPVNVSDGNIKATQPEIGLTRKQIHEARAVRDAEKMIVEAVNKFPFPPDLRSGSQ
jgi:hypothetical protein